MKIKWPVIQCAWQAESIINQDQFTAPVATIHTAYLGNGLVAFINHHQVIFWKIIQQAEGPCTWHSPVKETGIVLNAVAITQLTDHFNIIFHSFFQSLCFYELATIFKIVNLGLHFILYLIEHLL